MMNNKLLQLADRICSDHESGFRPGRGVTDSVFLLRRLIDGWRATKPVGAMAVDSSDSLFLLFVDLKKAFDAVPRDFLWRLLQTKAGVPAHIVAMLRDFHRDMTTAVSHHGCIGTAVPMRTGVRQGSVEGPTLYLLYYSFLLKQWRAKCKAQLGEFGIPWCACLDGSLRVPSRTRSTATHHLHITDCEFADDTLLVEDHWHRFQVITRLLNDTLTAFGAAVSTTKTEWMEIAGWQRSPPDAAPLPGCRILVVGADCIPKTGEFRYLGSLVSLDNTGGIKRDVGRRIQLAHAAFGQLRHVWKSGRITRNIKSRLLQSTVASVLLYGSESWVLDAPTIRSLTRTWQFFVRVALRLSPQEITDQRISHAQQLQMLQVPSLLTLLQRRLAGWIRHLARMDPYRLSRLMLFGREPARVLALLISKSAAIAAALPWPCCPFQNLELTCLLLQHDRDLRQLNAVNTVALKFDKDNSLATTLLQATKIWQQSHSVGHPHPMGACGTAVGTVLLKHLLEYGISKCGERDKLVLAPLEMVLATLSPQVICKEIALCSAKLNAKKTALILELQLHHDSRVFGFLPCLCQYLEELGCELLGPRPMGALVHKARNM
eukprot:s94_g26.t1